jgi:tetratricopeptide (TPR) repeat protein/AraC-like DNA-binding protein
MVRNHTSDQLFISELTKIILANLRNESFGVKQLAVSVGISQSCLYQRLHSINNKGINQFIREIRLQKALEILRNEDLTASEVSYRVGFSSPAYFNSCFHDFFGYTPGNTKKVITESPEEVKPVQFGTEPGQNEITRYSLIFNRSGILILGFFIFFLSIAFFLLFTSKIFNRGISGYPEDAPEGIYVGVMPFTNITNDNSYNVWQVGIPDNLISYLSNYPEEFRIRQTGAITSLLLRKGVKDYSSISPSAITKFSKRLDANVLIFGSINHSGNIIRINTQLIQSKTGDILGSSQLEGDAGNILHLVDALSVQIRDLLLILKLTKGDSRDYQGIEITTRSPKAFNYVKEGEKAMARGDFDSAVEMFLLALSSDSTCVYPAISISWAYFLQGMFNEGKEWCLKAYAKRNQMSLQQRIYADIVHAYFFKTPYEAIKYTRQLREIDDQTPFSYYQMGDSYFELQQYYKAIPEYKRSLEIYEERSMKPFYCANYTNLIVAYQKTGQAKKAKKLLRKAERDFSDDLSTVSSKAVLELTDENTVSANIYINRGISLLEENMVSEAGISSYLASVYSGAGLPGQALQFYRQALSLEPDNPLRMYNLACFLIDSCGKINEGMQLINQAIELSPENYSFYDCKGWGLYLQGRNKEALELLEKSWDLKPVYDHKIYLHMEEVRKAVSEDKNELN